MAQVFHRSANTIARASIIGVVLVVSVLLWAALEMQRSPYATYQMWRRPSRCPSAISTMSPAMASTAATATLRSRIRLCRHSSHQDLHELPFADLDERADAGAGARELPHRQSLIWTRVHDLPDFVYFDHSIHINKGVGCASCHGPVDKMPLTTRHTRCKWNGAWTAIARRRSFCVRAIRYLTCGTNSPAPTIR